MSSNWIYQGQVVTEAPADAVGMVYAIYKMDSPWHREMAEKGIGCTGNYSHIYIGKKLLHSTRKSKIGKREIAATKTRKRVRRVTKDSGWLNYNSSCIPLQKELKEHPELFRKEILHWTYSKKETSYREIEEQILHDVLRKPSYNECIAGHYWKKDLLKPITKPTE